MQIFSKLVLVVYFIASFLPLECIVEDYFATLVTLFSTNKKYPLNGWMAYGYVSEGSSA